jgi:8-oxo-dGTP diphosphatase
MNEVIKRPGIGINVFLIKDGKVLMGKRIGKVGYGTWCLPGGHLEFLESLESAAKRELLEETGIKAVDLEFLHLINDPSQKDNTHYIHINFLAKKWDGEPKLMEPDKFEKWEWFDLHNLPENVFAGHQKMVPAYLGKIGFEDNEA